MKTLLFAGTFLVLLGSVCGLVIPYFHNPRMGLSAHLGGVQNGILLIIIGLMWKHVSLSAWSGTLCTILSIAGLYAIWIGLVLAGVWGASAVTPIAGAGFSGTSGQEAIVKVLLYAGSLSVLVALIQLCVGVLSARNT